MAVLKCKMCGGDIEVSQDMTVGKCLYCGSTMTLPRIETERKARLFNRANEYRLNNEFDKAYEAYKTIVEEDEQEAEAYWGMILSEYGVEYVEDPASHKRIPTCHRTRMQNIRSTSNYQLAIQYADSERKFIYQDEAEILDKLQRSILAISSREEPYDVFICYKETDDSTGERTKDSVLAQDIYQELEKNGIRTFFSRISLETHLGENYEPYIYSALKSARVMLMVSMSAQNCEAIWVKNEWSRFLSFMGEDDSKMLIPVYQEMSPYEFPSELSGFQAQDMGKVGAIQDLVYGVKKILGTTKAETHDATLQALVADKMNREEDLLKKKKQKQKAEKIIMIVLLAVLAIGALGFAGYKLNNARLAKLEEEEKIKWSKLIEEDIFVSDSEIPSCDEYTKLDLLITNDNIGNLIQGAFRDENKNGLEYSSLLYGKGWVFIGSQEIKIEKYGGGRVIFNGSFGNKREFLPLNAEHVNRRKIELNDELFKVDTDFHAYFISKNAIEEYTLDGNIRRIKLKDGTVIENYLDFEPRFNY